MQKRTTNYSFQKFGDVFYSVNHNSGHLVDYVENDFKDFLKNMQNSLKDEFYIPTVINNMIHKHNFDIKVLESSEKWYGVTYREDKKSVAEALKQKIEKGYYDGI